MKYNVVNMKYNIINMKLYNLDISNLMQREEKLWFSHKILKNKKQKNNIISFPCPQENHFNVFVYMCVQLIINHLFYFQDSYNKIN